MPLAVMVPLEASVVAALMLPLETILAEAVRLWQEISAGKLAEIGWPCHTPVELMTGVDMPLMDNCCTVAGPALMLPVSIMADAVIRPVALITGVVL